MTENEKNPKSSAFLEYLTKLRDRDDRAALAALRKGVGKPPGTVVEMFRYVVPFTGGRSSRWDQNAHFILGSLFALHPQKGGRGNMGEVFRRIKGKTDSESVEGRFMALLNCHEDLLQNHLRHAVSLARSKEVPVNWDELFKDLRNWKHPDRWVQRKWAESYWGGPTESKKTNGKSEIKEE